VHHQLDEAQLFQEPAELTELASKAAVSPAPCRGDFGTSESVLPNSSRH
jgi:hypothetical protein